MKNPRNKQLAQFRRVRRLVNRALLASREAQAVARDLGIDHLEIEINYAVNAAHGALQSARSAEAVAMNQGGAATPPRH